MSRKRKRNRNRNRDKERKNNQLDKNDEKAKKESPIIDEEKSLNTDLSSDRANRRDARLGTILQY